MKFEALHPVLAEKKVRYVGEPVAAVVATNPQIAQAALEAIQVTYAVLPAVIDQEAALAQDAPRLHDSDDNIAVKQVKTQGDYEGAKVTADVVVKRRITNNRCAPSPLEGRAVLSLYDPVLDHLTHYTSTQLPHVHARALATCLGFPVNKLRLISPDVGGGFGAKLGFYAEDVLVAFAAKTTGQACVWLQSRVENTISTTHGRDHIHDVELAAMNDGRIVGLKATMIADLGAYALGMGPGIPAINTGYTITGPYRIANVISDMTIVYTNRMATGPYRGAGHPEANFMLERMVDELAFELKLDPITVRKRNFIQLRLCLTIPYFLS